MSSQPPSHQSDPSAVVRGGAHAESRKVPAWKPIAIIVAAVLIAGAIAGTLLLNQTDEQPKESANGPARGLACPFLQQASDAYNSGDNAAYEAAIRQAKEVAEGTLQTSGQAFGKPERIALELGLAIHPDVPGLLTKASEACATP